MSEMSDDPSFVNCVNDCLTFVRLMLQHNVKTYIRKLKIILSGAFLMFIYLTILPFTSHECSERSAHFTAIFAPPILKFSIPVVPKFKRTSTCYVEYDNFGYLTFDGLRY